MRDKKSIPQKKPSSYKTKIQRVQDIYGKDGSSATLKEASDYFSKVGYKSFSELLKPSV